MKISMSYHNTSATYSNQENNTIFHVRCFSILYNQVCSLLGKKAGTQPRTKTKKKNKKKKKKKTKKKKKKKKKETKSLN